MQRVFHKHLALQHHQILQYSFILLGTVKCCIFPKFQVTYIAKKGPGKHK